MTLKISFHLIRRTSAEYKLVCPVTHVYNVKKLGAAGRSLVYTSGSNTTNQLVSSYSSKGSKIASRSNVGRSTDYCCCGWLHLVDISV